MKDLSNYSYTELIDMINHINEYKYEDRLEEVRKELEIRRQQGEIPTVLVPKPDWSAFRFRRRKKEVEENV